MAYWRGLAFARLCGGALLTVGLVLTNLAPQRQRYLRIGVVVGLTVLTGLAVIQQIAIWTTRGGWFLVAILVVATVSAGLSLRSPVQGAAQQDLYSRLTPAGG